MHTARVLGTGSDNFCINFIFIFSAIYQSDVCSRPNWRWVVQPQQNTHLENTILNTMALVRTDMRNVRLYDTRFIPSSRRKCGSLSAFSLTNMATSWGFSVYSARNATEWAYEQVCAVNVSRWSGGLLRWFHCVWASSLPTHSLPNRVAQTDIRHCILLYK